VTAAAQTSVAEGVAARQLRRAIAALAPWHHDVEVVHGVSTGAAAKARRRELDGTPIALVEDAREGFDASILDVFPNGLAGRSVLDCACNCGAYTFWAKELGAGRCFGFDARPHWIDQARFLASHRVPRPTNVRFEVLDLHALPALDLEPFDVTLFNGILYHLPDPVTGLKVAADLTREVLIVNTATRNGLPDGLLALAREGFDPLSGITGLAWFPTGPAVVSEMLSWLGFPEARCLWWIEDVPQQPPELGRLLLIAARDAAAFEYFDATSTTVRAPARTSAERQAAPPSQVPPKRPLDAASYARLVERVRTTLSAVLPPEATVAVVSKGDDALLAIPGRRAYHFPQGADGGYAGFYPTDGAAAVAHVEDLRSRGVDHLVFPATASWWLDHYVELARHLAARYAVAHAESGVCVVYDLRGRTGRAAAPRRSRAASGEPARCRDLVTRLLPPGAALAVLARDDTPPLDGAQEVRLAGRCTADAEHAVIAEIERLGAEGAAYLVVPSSAFDWLRRGSRVRDHLARRHRLVTRNEHTCAIYALNADTEGEDGAGA
jgi:SAM-dependent methyltransferase